MKQNFTLNDLTRFLYRETSSSEALAIREALSEDAELRGQYEEILQGYHMFPRVKFRPAPAVVKNILQYSAMTALENQH